MFICFQYGSLYQVLELTVKYVQMVKERMPPSVLQEVCFIFQVLPRIFLFAM